MWPGGDGGITNDRSGLGEIQFLLPGTVLNPRDTDGGKIISVHRDFKQQRGNMGCVEEREW